MTAAASIYSLVGDDRARAESAAWARFTAPADAREFSAGWLAILCAQVELAKGALLLLRSGEEGAYGVAAVWPDAGRPMQHLAPAAERTLREKCGVVVGPDGASVPNRDEPAYVGYPIEVAGCLHGAVVLHLPPCLEPDLQRALRLLHWGAAWLVDHFRQQMQVEMAASLERQALVADVLATALEEQRLAPAALAVANELAARLQCDRVSLGFEQDGGVEILAISHTATFDRRTNLVRLIGEAMDEVLDLDVAMRYPAADGDEFGVLAHAELARECKDIAACSVPLAEHGHAIGVLTLERTTGEIFSAADVALLKTVGLALGPVLALKRDNERGIWRRGRDHADVAMRVLFGPRHPGAKLIALLLAGAIVFFSLASGEYRVAAKTVIEGAVQRAAVAPFEGYVAESLVRAGDTVRRGQVLCRLDDKDLTLERTRWTAERDQLLGKHRQAFAVQDRATMQMVAAQISQAEAQLALAEDKLARATLIAPFDGVVVSGDLSQLLGTPVEQGKVLFEIAPLDAYRVILQVDERDIADVRLSQSGELALSGLPHQTMDFVVKQITPVTTPQEGRNHFRVEARLEQASERLRPGMEGIGKIAIGERKLIWIWTHSLVDWLRLAAWNWLP
ncbi:MAG: hypothetical protein JWR07_5019 [Nevskia sp.]|nr:hypothetical protein [Nevskia sp.]